MRDFKFFQPEKKERVFTDFMDALDDYHLGGIPLPSLHNEVPAQRRAFSLNVMVEVFGRLPSFVFLFESSNPDDYEVLRGTTIGQLTSGELDVPMCFTEMSITRVGDNSNVTITYDNVSEMDRMGLIFNPEDTVTIIYKQ